MIITLADAQKINPNIDQLYLDGLEASIRQLTNNSFVNKSVVYRGFSVGTGNTIKFRKAVKYLRVGDTILLTDTGVNNGLYTVESVAGKEVTVLGSENLYDGTFVSGAAYKVEYPADIVSGVKKILEYDLKMSDKVGVKSKTIARMTETYYDINSTENVNGYPSAYMSFLNKYKKLRW